MSEISPSLVPFLPAKWRSHLQTPPNGCRRTYELKSLLHCMARAPLRVGLPLVRLFERQLFSDHPRQRPQHQQGRQGVAPDHRHGDQAEEASHVGVVRHEAWADHRPGFGEAAAVPVPQKLSKEVKQRRRSTASARCTPRECSSAFPPVNKLLTKLDTAKT